MTLALVALAVAVAELFIIRDRMWLFGLSRASGARRIDITKIVILDVVGVLILGVTAAIALSLIFSPAFRNFGESVFQTEIVLFRLDLLPLLLVFLVFGVGIGSLIPVLKVLKLDPADSIELR
jgi:ABC-type antimicrobial peptide transport system permease subunit